MRDCYKFHVKETGLKSAPGLASEVGRSLKAEPSSGNGNLEILAKHTANSAMMELWCCGFNAWGQLVFKDDLSTVPRDMNAFECVASDSKNIEILRTTLSATLGKLMISSLSHSCIQDRR